MTGLIDGPRWQCALTVERLTVDASEEAERLGEVVTFRITKSNYAPKPEPILLRREVDHGGALRPLDEADCAAVEKARAAGKAGVADRAARQSVREEADATRRTEQAQADERAALRVVMRSQGLNGGDLRTAVKREARCGQTRAVDALRTLSPYLRVEPGPNKSARHYPPSSPEPLPPHLRKEFSNEH